MNTHSFSTEIAEQLGVEGALMLQHLYFWHQRNEGNDKNFHDDHYWTYNSIKGFSAIFPYLKEYSIRKILEKLEQQEYILTGNYNKVKYDRTKWYCLTTKGLGLLTNQNLSIPKNPLSKTTNAFKVKDTPIPDINTDIKKKYKKEISEINQEGKPSLDNNSQSSSKETSKKEEEESSKQTALEQSTKLSSKQTPTPLEESSEIPFGYNQQTLHWIMSKWNRIAEKKEFLSEIRKIEGARKSKLKTRLKAFPDKKDWIELFKLIEQDRYLGMFKKTKSWFDFDYPFKTDTTFMNVLKGWVEFCADKEMKALKQQPEPMPDRMKNRIKEIEAEMEIDQC